MRLRRGAETPEQREQRLDKERERYAEKRAGETAEEHAAFLAKKRENARAYLARKKAAEANPRKQGEEVLAAARSERALSPQTGNGGAP